MLAEHDKNRRGIRRIWFGPWSLTLEAFGLRLSVSHERRAAGSMNQSVSLSGSWKTHSFERWWVNKGSRWQLRHHYNTVFPRHKRCGYCPELSELVAAGITKDAGNGEYSAWMPVPGERLPAGAVLSVTSTVWLGGKQLSTATRPVAFSTYEGREFVSPHL